MSAQTKLGHLAWHGSIRWSNCSSALSAVFLAKLYERQEQWLIIGAALSLALSSLRFAFEGSGQAEQTRRRIGYQQSKALDSKVLR